MTRFKHGPEGYVEYHQCPWRCHAFKFTVYLWNSFASWTIYVPEHNLRLQSARSPFNRSTYKYPEPEEVHCIRRWALAMTRRGNEYY